MEKIMSTKSPRTFTREFKFDLCRQIKSGQKRPAQLCREHLTSEGLLLRWRHEYDRRGEAAFSPKEYTEASPTAALEQKVAELERFCGQLSLENTILKKVGRHATLDQHYAVIIDYRREHPEASVRQMCRMLGISRSWLYEKPVPAAPGWVDN